MRANDVEYFAPARFDDTIEIFCRRFGSAARASTFEFAAYRVEDDALMVTAQQTVVYVDLAERKAMPDPGRRTATRSARSREATSRHERRRARERSRRSSPAAATPTTSCGRSSPHCTRTRATPGPASSSSRTAASRSARKPARRATAGRTTVPVAWQGERVAELAVEGAAAGDEPFLERSPRSSRATASSAGTPAASPGSRSRSSLRRLRVRPSPRRPDAAASEPPPPVAL